MQLHQTTHATVSYQQSRYRGSLGRAWVGTESKDGEVIESSNSASQKGPDRHLLPAGAVPRIIEKVCAYSLRSLMCLVSGDDGCRKHTTAACTNPTEYSRKDKNGNPCTTWLEWRCGERPKNFTS